MMRFLYSLLVRAMVPLLRRKLALRARHEPVYGQWIEERCILSKTHREGVSNLFTDWREWAERAGEYVGSIKRFSELMSTRKFEKCRLHGGARAIAGISLRPKPHSGSGYPYRDD